jgi:hypothetical protein
VKVPTRLAKPKGNRNQYAELLGLLQQVKITTTAAQVEAVVNELYPAGIDGIDPGNVVGAIIDRLRGQNPPIRSADNCQYRSSLAHSLSTS